MAKYVLIESRDPFEYADVGYMCSLAADLASAGNETALFLVQNGVLMARSGVKDNPIEALRKRSAGGRVEVLADEFSVRERGIQAGGFLPGIKSSSVDHLVDLLLQDGMKAVWH